jgi:ABC-type nitrate/sulfonate/bicarbonate transport system substrate-binding protein
MPHAIRLVSICRYIRLCAPNARQSATSLFIVLFALAPIARAHAAEKLRLGWQTPWATQGQLVSVLQRTNIPALAGIDLTYIGFGYGAPLNRAALAGEVDVLLTADQPAAVLIDKGGKFRIVARMMYNRTCVYSHPRSRYTALASLHGARLLGPTGAAAERVALELLSQHGVDLRKLSLGDLDMAGQAALVRAGSDALSWRGVDALYGFDPLPAVWEHANSVRILGCGKVVSFVVASKALVDSGSPTLRKFLQAFSLAWRYYAEHPQQANQWFRSVASLDFPDSALETAAEIEPNRKAKSMRGVSLDVTSEDVGTFRKAVTFLQQRGQVRNDFNVDAAFELKDWAEVKAAVDELEGRYRDVKANN